ncbi:MAG: hypothetical protein JW825_01150, partial [Candidatus Methanofastidiosa archaeon]|nr:hypothetical protein [Candidatus Methanofastidiosa archaeon]
ICMEKKRPFVPSICNCKSCMSLLSTTEVDIEGDKLAIKGIMELLTSLAGSGVDPSDSDFNSILEELKKVNDIPDDKRQMMIKEIKRIYNDII